MHCVMIVHHHHKTIQGAQETVHLHMFARNIKIPLILAMVNSAQEAYCHAICKQTLCKKCKRNDEVYIVGLVKDVVSHFAAAFSKWATMTSMTSSIPCAWTENKWAIYAGCMLAKII
jgi:hypothetical protein